MKKVLGFPRLIVFQIFIRYNDTMTKPTNVEGYMNAKDLTDLGKDLSKDIKKIVQDSRKTGDYNKMGKDMNQVITTRIDSIIKDVHQTVNNVMLENNHLRMNDKREDHLGGAISTENQKPDTELRDDGLSNGQVTSSDQQRSEGWQTVELDHGGRAKGRQARESRRSYRKSGMGPGHIIRQGNNNQMNDLYFPHMQVGKVQSVLLTVFGSIGIASFGLSVLLAATTGAGTGAMVTLLAFLGASIIMEYRGTFIRNRNKRFRRYLDFLLGKKRALVGELADFVGESEKFIYKDIKKMIELGMLPQSHLSRDKSQILLNRIAYTEYIEEVKEEQAVLTGHNYSMIEDSESDELRETFEDGRLFISEINKANLSIIDSEVSNKVHHMERVINQIIDYVEAHPDQLSDVRRFMDYYLPTTVKLLKSYEEFEKQDIQGSNIQNARKEIKQALDTINLAFENLFDNLFANASMDVSTDISVLQTMFNQEGLMEQEFSVSTTREENHE